ncbi:acyltransferase family protein [Empedobacter brevis]|uniref:Acyltransferase n=1 Tax=Empedobacter brevis NBRC 14943 = ATCC 43319 TaxID=1218108 RepID=A0A511NI73_9FLAO|nr:acyltransferase [Empedobacter brevis]GEM52396.1 acyltransferase [Empedobacter brevis NBRC 14943 = ATCC 43319]
MKTLPNLTQLRFFLASLVILFHIAEFCKNRGFPYYNDLAVFFKGTEAVYVFFTLSGFLIIRNLIQEKTSTDTIDLKRFYKKRILRIFPLYYLILIFGFIYYNYVIELFGYSNDNNYNLIQGLSLGLTFFANILATYKPGGILEILWSIAIEEQFYLLIAPIFLIINKKNILKFLFIFTVVYFIIYHIPFLDILRKYKMLFFYFSAGGFFSYISLYKAYKLNAVLKSIILVLFITSLTTNIFINNLNDLLYHSVCTIIFSSSIYVLSLQPYKILNNDWLKYLGKISYGIYMYHAIVFQIVGFLFLRLTYLDPVLFILLFYFSVFTITILISAISYKYFETTFLKLKNK